MVVTGPKIEQLADTLLSAFPRNADLEHFILVELSTRLNWHVDVNAGLKHQASELITWAIDERRIKDLVLVDLVVACRVEAARRAPEISPPDD